MVGGPYHALGGETKRAAFLAPSATIAPMPTAMVLAAGLGTRLRPLTDELPKPLMPIGPRSALAHILESLSRAGVSRAVVNTHHLASEFTNHIEALPIELKLVHEPEILGTAGGLANASPLLGMDEVVVWNGDIHAPSLDVISLLVAHQDSHASATFLIAPRPRGEGTVGLDEAGQVVRLRGRSFGEEARGGDFLGISILGHELRSQLPQRGCLIGDLALPFLARGGTIATCSFAGEWRDIGTPEALLEANLAWLAKGGRQAYRAASAQITGEVSLMEAVVSEGASVVGQGMLRRVLVLPGGQAKAPLEDAVVGRRGVVRLR